MPRRHTFRDHHRGLRQRHVGWPEVRTVDLFQKLQTDILHILGPLSNVEARRFLQLLYEELAGRRHRLAGRAALGDQLEQPVQQGYVPRHRQVGLQNLDFGGRSGTGERYLQARAHRSRRLLQPLTLLLGDGRPLAVQLRRQAHASHQHYFAFADSPAHHRSGIPATAYVFERPRQSACLPPRIRAG